MATLNVMDDRTERGERFFFELMRRREKHRTERIIDRARIQYHIPVGRRCARARETRDNNKHNSVAKLPVWLMNYETQATKIIDALHGEKN